VSLGDARFKIIGPVAGVGLSLQYAAEYAGRGDGGGLLQGAIGEYLIPAMQVLISDDKGRFTDDPECALQYPGVKILTAGADCCVISGA
jgi:hypothetical protein